MDLLASGPAKYLSVANGANDSTNKLQKLIDDYVKNVQIMGKYFISPSLDGTYYGMVLSVRPSVRHTCASALSGWVLYRQLELTKLTRPDLHHVVGLFILKAGLDIKACPHAQGM